MLNRFASALALSLLSGSVLAQTSPAEEDLLTRINQLRIEGISCPGSGPRPVAGTLLPTPAHAQAADMQARYMAATHQVSHIGAGGSTPKTRAAKMGLSAVSLTEIIYLGSGNNPEKAINWWRNSAVHCAVMTDPRYTHAAASVVSGGGSTAYVVVLSSRPK